MCLAVCYETLGVMLGAAPVMFLWIFSVVIGVGCRVTLLYYSQTPTLQHSFLHFCPYYLFQSLKVSLSSSPSSLYFYFFLSFVRFHPFFLGCLPLKMTMRLARVLPKE